MERLQKIWRRQPRQEVRQAPPVAVVDSVAEAIKLHNRGYEVTFDAPPLPAITAPNTTPTQTEQTTPKPTVPVEFLADNLVQTIPGDHPVAEAMVGWLATGGPAPVDHTELPKEQVIPKTAQTVVEFPRVIAAINKTPDVTQTPFSRLRRGTQAIKEGLRGITRRQDMLPGREYRTNGD